MLTDRLGLTREEADPQTLERTVEHFRQARIALPTFAQLAHPALIPARGARGAHARRPGRRRIR